MISEAIVTYSNASDMLIYGAMAAYAVALVAFSIDLARLADRSSGNNRKLAGVGQAVTWAGFLMHAVAVLLRGLAVSRMPWANMYEFAITATLIAVAVYLGVQVLRDMRVLGAPVTGIVLLILGAAVTLFYVDPRDLVPALQNYWLIIHVSIATISVGVLTVAFLISVLQLIVDKHGRARESAEKGAASTRGADAISAEAASAASPSAADAASATSAEAASAATLASDSTISAEAVSATATTGVETVSSAQAGTDAAPAKGKRAWQRILKHVGTPQQLEGAAFRLNAIGFVLWTFTLIAGAIWAEEAWGRFWGWDPKEVWTFIIWVVYAAYLHARATRGWAGARAAWFAIVGYACIIFNYTIVNLFFNSIHAYSGIG